MRASSTWRAAIATLGLAAPRLSAAQSAAAPTPPAHAAPSGRAGTDRDAIVAEVRAFYAAVHARRWPEVLDHFMPAKVTARWAPPVSSPAWTLAEPALAAADTSRAGSGGPACVGAEEGVSQAPRVAVVGAWARVLVADCAAARAGDRGDGGARPARPIEGARDELWLLRVSGRWKIVHLDRGAAGARD